MANVPYTGVPDTAPPSQPPSDYQQPQSVRTPVGAFGERSAAGLESLGEGAQQAGQFFGQVAADHAYNSYQDSVNKILHGDPSKMVTAPDGTQIPDSGYFGLKGEAAMRARPDVVKQMDDLRKSTLGGLPSPAMQIQFDTESRKLQAITTGQVGTHADTQTNVWAQEGLTAKLGNAVTMASNNPENPQVLLDAREQARSAAVKSAQLKFGNSPEIIQHAIQQADNAIVKAQVLAISVNDPAKAMRIVENNRTSLGPQYEILADHLRPRVATLAGQASARQFIGETTGAAPPSGDNTAEVIKHFEGFLPTPKVDSDGKLRAGYGSDTVTRADGTVSPVTANTVVTKEDAERDLTRRTAETQSKIKDAIGADAWSNLTPQTQASLTSVAYNYGTLPESVATAVKTGDKEAIGESIANLASHNGGINANRRASEAANISGHAMTIGQQHGAVLQRILDDPDMQAHPEKQSAAIAESNKYFEAKRMVQTGETVVFRQRLKDSTAEAVATGTVKNPLSEADFLRNYGPDKGSEAYEEYQGAIQFGADKKALGSMSPQEVASTLARVPLPEPGPGYAAAFRRRSSLIEASKAIAKARQEDMGYAAINQMPTVKAAWDQANVQGLSPPDQAARMQHFAETSLTEQERVGIPPDQRHVLPASVAQTYAQKMIESGDPKATLSQLQTQFGSNFPQVFRDMVTVGKMSPMMQAVAGIPDLDAAQLTAWIKGTSVGQEGKTQHEKGHALAVKQLGTTAVSGIGGIDDAIRSNDAFQKLAHSWRLTGGPAAENWISGMTDAVHNLAYAKAVQAGSPADAADKAVKAFTSQYEFMPSGALVPAKQFDTVTENSRAVLDGLTPEKIVVPPLFGQPGQATPQEYIGLLQANPQWITSPKADGLWLMDSGGKLVRGKDGQPFELKFDAPAIHPKGEMPTAGFNSGAPQP